MLFNNAYVKLTFWVRCSERDKINFSRVATFPWQPNRIVVALLGVEWEKPKKLEITGRSLPPRYKRNVLMRENKIFNKFLKKLFHKSENTMGILKNFFKK
jgi:hypothetical protein